MSNTPKYKYGQKVVIDKKAYSFYDGCEVTIQGVTEASDYDEETDVHEDTFVYGVLLPFLDGMQGKNNEAEFFEKDLHPVKTEIDKAETAIRGRFKVGDWVRVYGANSCFEVQERDEGFYPFYKYQFDPNVFVPATKEKVRIWLNRNQKD